MDGSLYPQTRKKLSDAERAALAQKLDDELDEFMEQMATKKRDREAENPETKKPFDFDEWCKEIEQHPCFMTDKTNINDCLNGKYGDTIAAMQAMKYDEEDSTEDKQITAEKQKAEGNKHFQNKKYRWAIECYTKGIKARCFDRKLNGILYSNRAASNKYLENYRSAIKDAIQARRFDPTNLKATIHAVESLLKLGYGKEAVDLIDQSKKLFALTKETEDGGNVVEGETKLLKDLDNLYKDAEVKYAVQRKQNKQRREEEKADLTEKTKLLAALKERKLNMAPRVPFDHPELFDYARIRVQLAQVSHEHDKVTLDWEMNLVWPIMLQYPEVGYTDVITEVSETCGVEELMDSVLAEQAPFDPDHLYKPRSVRYFVTSEYDEFLIEVKKKLTFGQILSAPNYQIRHGLPTILIFSSKHVMEKLQKIGSSDGFDHFIIIAVYIGANRLPEPCSPVSPNAVKATCIDPRTIDLTMQRLSRLVDNVCLLEPEDPETFSPLEKKIRRGLGLSFRGLVAVFFAWHVFDFLFSAIWMHGYVWSLNLPIDLDLSDKSAGSIVYHQKNVVGAFERIYHAFGAVVGIFLMMLCSGFASGKDMKVWELVKLATGLGFLVAAVRGCQIKHRLFSALHEGFYTVFLVFFVGVILAIQSAAPAKENSQPEAVKEEEKKNN